MNNKEKKLTQHQRFILAMLVPGILVVLAFTYYPLSRGIMMAFESYTLFNIFDRHFIGLGNFIAVVNNPEFPLIMGHTFLWVFVSLFFQFTLGFALALLLKKKFKGSGIYQGIVYVPWAISGFLIGLIWRWLMNGQSGAINDLLMRMHLITEPIRWLSDTKIALWSVIIANVWYGVPFFAIMIQAALKGVPDDLYEAADIDGCSTMYKFTRVTLPYIKPVLVLTTLLRVIWILNFPDLIYTMTGGGPAGSSHTISTYMIDMLMFNQDYGKASAIGVIIIALLVAYAVFYLRFTQYEEGSDF